MAPQGRLITLPYIAFCSIFPLVFDLFLAHFLALKRIQNLFHSKMRTKKSGAFLRRISTLTTEKGLKNSPFFSQKSISNPLFDSRKIALFLRTKRFRKFYINTCQHLENDVLQIEICNNWLNSFTDKNHVNRESVNL